MCSTWRRTVDVVARWARGAGVGGVVGAAVCVGAGGETAALERPAGAGVTEEATGADDCEGGPDDWGGAGELACGAGSGAGVGLGPGDACGAGAASGDGLPALALAGA